MSCSYKELNHIMDFVPKFKILTSKLEEIKDKIVDQSGISKTSQDARMVALESIQVAISATGMWIISLNSLANECSINNILDRDKFLLSVGSGIDIDRTEMVMFDHLRLGFMTLVHFKFDSLFQNILRHLNKIGINGYHMLTDEILKVCSIQINGREKKVLAAFASLRNSLHENGIYRRKKGLSLKIKGIDFEFKPDRRVTCSGWKHIIILLEEHINILKMILLSDAVANIRNEIIDDFASGK